MKLLIEFENANNDATQIYRKVLTKNAQAVRLTNNDDGKSVVEVWFENNELFELLVNMILEINFCKVVMINDDSKEPAQTHNESEGRDKDESLVVEEDGGGELDQNHLPPVVEEGGDFEEETPPENQDPPDKDVPPVTDEVIGNQPIVVQESAPKADSPKPEDLIQKKGKATRRREGKNVTNLFEVPNFPQELTVENILMFFEPMKARIKEPLKDVLSVVFSDKECSMEWKDIVNVSAEWGRHLTDYDKVLVSKKIADTFEAAGYSVRMKEVLKLIRSHLAGEVIPIKKADAEPPKTDVQKIEFLTDIPDFKWLENIRLNNFSKEDIITRILKQMKADTGLTLPAQKLFYYMTICAVSMREYKVEGVDLLLEDMNLPDVKRTPELDKEINDFVEAYMKEKGVTCSCKYLYRLMNQFFVAVFAESDASFVTKIRSFEDSFGIKVAQKEPVSRFGTIPYHEGLEEEFSRLFDEGHGLNEILANLIAYMSDGELDDDECRYLDVCAERIAFDSLNDIYLDLGVNQTEARRIQVKLSERIMEFTERNNFKSVKLYDFIQEVREIYAEEA